MSENDEAARDAIAGVLAIQAGRDPAAVVRAIDGSLVEAWRFHIRAADAILARLGAAGWRLDHAR